MPSGKEEYSDIFDRPHHVSTKRAPMSRLNRAAQFSPFAALSDDELAQLNEQLSDLLCHIDEQPEVTVLYFEPDARKTGGAYREYTGKVKRVREYEEVVEMDSGLFIPFSDIASISRA